MKFIMALSLKMKIIIIACTVAAAAAVGAVIIINSEETYRVIKVFELNGSAVVTRENTGDIDAYAGMNLESGDTLSVEENSTLQISLDSDKYILLDGGTVLKLIAQGTAADSRTVIELQTGTILNEIKNSLSANSSYEVNTPKATMAVRGTTFTVTTIKNPDGSYVTELHTAEGTVYVQLFDENGAPKGNGVYVNKDGFVTIITDVNDKTGNPAAADGNAYFVLRTDDGYAECKEENAVQYTNDTAFAEVQTEQVVTSVPSDTSITETSEEYSETTVTSMTMAKTVTERSYQTERLTVSLAAKTFAEKRKRNSETTLSERTTTAAPETTTEPVTTTVPVTKTESATTTVTSATDVPVTTVSYMSEYIPTYTSGRPVIYVPPIVTSVPTETESKTVPTETTVPTTTTTEPITVTTEPTTTTTEPITVTTEPTTTTTEPITVTTEPTATTTEPITVTTEPTTTTTEPITVTTEPATTTTEPTITTEPTTSTTEETTTTEPPKVYVVSFIDENGNVLSEAEFDENETLGTLPQIADKKGYTAKWVSGGAEVTADTVISADMDITAEYTPRLVTVYILAPYDDNPESVYGRIDSCTVLYDRTFSENNAGYTIESLTEYVNSRYEEYYELYGRKYVLQYVSTNGGADTPVYVTDDYVISGDNIFENPDDGTLYTEVYFIFGGKHWYET